MTNVVPDKNDAPRWCAGIVRIEVHFDGEEKSRGTGALVAPQTLLTALHVIAENKEPENQSSIKIDFGIEGEPLRNASVVDGMWDAEEDWVLLYCENAPTSINPLPLANVNSGEQHDPILPWRSFGFPDAFKQGWSFLGSIAGLDPYQKTHVLNLSSDQLRQLRDSAIAEGYGSPQKKHRVQGISGAPILVDGYVVGVIRSHLGGLVGGTLYATPLSFVLRKTENLLPKPTELDPQANAKQVRELLLQDIASWGDSIIFDTPDDAVEQKNTLSPLLLEKLYVEPSAAFAKGKDSHRVFQALNQNKAALGIPSIKALQELKKSLSDPREKGPFLVTAYFGHGKSLTARMLARDLARTYLKEPDKTLQPYPIFVRCVDDLQTSNEKLDLEQTVKFAWISQAEKLDLFLSDDDEALCFPPSEEKVVVILDGLDECLLPNVANLLEQLWGKSSNKRRFVVFSRPAVLPDPTLLEKRKYPVLGLLPFETTQIEDWLSRWKTLSTQPAPTYNELKAWGLKEIAKTPILLFMIAMIWSELPPLQPGEKPSLAIIYEGFFKHISIKRGDQKGHKLAQNTAEKVNEQLQEKGKHLFTNPEAAMLWLMSRIAWESHRLAWKKSLQSGGEMKKSLSIDRGTLKKILKEELGVEPEEELLSGLCLVLQVSAQKSTGKFLFGHRSFQEFLVARYWAYHLCYISTLSQEKQQEAEKKLLGGRLLMLGSKSFDFLLEILQSNICLGHKEVSQSQNKDIIAWAHRCFHDESLFTLEQIEGAVTIATDQRFLLREAALAIGSHLKDNFDVSGRKGQMLRSLLAVFFVNDLRPRILAPKASFVGTILEGASLEGAKLNGANLEFASLYEANLEFANLEGANLEGANLEGANLVMTNLVDANLINAELEGANLIDAELEGANLIDANLEGAHLEGADLYEAKLNGAKLNRAIFSRGTTWPEGFDISSSGMILRDPD